MNTVRSFSRISKPCGIFGILQHRDCVRKEAISNGAKSESGLSLVEVMIGMTVLMLSLIGILGAVAQSMRLNEMLSNYDTAEAATSSKTEEIKVFAAGDYNGTFSQFNGDTFVAATTSVYYVGGTTQIFTMLRGLDKELCTVNIDNTNPDLLEATVTVTWEDIQGAQSFELQTLLTR